MEISHLEVWISTLMPIIVIIINQWMTNKKVKKSEEESLERSEKLLEEIRKDQELRSATDMLLLGQALTEVYLKVLRDEYRPCYYSRKHYDLIYEQYCKLGGNSHVRLLHDLAVERVTIDATTKCKSNTGSFLKCSYNFAEDMEDDLLKLKKENYNNEN